MRKFIVVKSEQVVNPETGEVNYHDTIERRPQELINVWDPNGKIRQTKHVKRRSSIEARKIITTLNHNERVFLFTVEPYLEWETNLVIGDGVTAGKKDKPLLWKDIDGLLGMDERTRRKTVESLEKKNLIGYLESQHKRKGIVINPILILNGRSPSPALLNTFLSSKELEKEEK